MKKLLKLRKKINKYDKKITNLLNKRFGVVSDIFNEKIKIDKQIIDSEREKIVLDNVSKYSKDYLLNYNLSIYNEIITQSKNLQEEIKK